RVGGNGEIQVDVRVISATNRDVDELLREGRFREDLYYRLNPITVRPPALRDRPGDVPDLAAHFAQTACRRNHWKPRALARDAVDLLRQQPWKGNVRELKNVVERALILSDADEITAADLRPALPVAPVQRGSSPPGEGTLKDLVDGYER